MQAGRIASAQIAKIGVGLRAPGKLSALLPALLLLGLAACAPPESTGTRFIAASPMPREPVQDEVERRLRAAIAAHEQTVLRRAAGLGRRDTAPFAHPDPTLQQRHADAQGPAADLDGGRIAALAAPAEPAQRRHDGIWRRAQGTLYLGAAGPLPPIRPFRFSGLHAEVTEIFLRSVADQPLRVTASCNGPLRLLQREGGNRAPAAAQDFAFTLQPGAQDTTRLMIPRGTDACDLTIATAAAAPAAAHSLRLEREETADPALGALDSRHDVCTIPPLSTLDPLEQTFFADRWMSQSCPMPLGTVRLLPDERQAFNAKVQALTGTTLSDAQLDAGDPEMPLDFRRAPRLDLIYVSFLHIRADFSGMLLSRMLRHHAARGATIRILTSNNLMLEKEHALFGRLAADHPNIQIQKFEWTPPGATSIPERIDRLHRSHHVKLFAALSPDPGRSRAMLGGRNIHDGFLFDEPRDLTAYPQLRDYRPRVIRTLDFFSSYVDFELEIASDAQVRTLAAHLSTLWHRDPVSNVQRPFSVSVEGAAPRRGMRHFISAPYADAMALETWYEELFDSATQRIEIVTPYLNPTPRIAAALDRALERGVEVRIVARIEVTDPGGAIITELNRLFVERYADRMAIFDYIPGDKMLHSKLLMIDGRLSVVTSTNLNRRSFLHDSENGIAVLDRGFYTRLREVFDGYVADATRLDADQTIPGGYRALFRLQALLDLI